jgi:type II secretory pathway pseudopilin PulG
MKKSSRAKGFTILEIMFSAAILAGLLVSAAGVFVYCMELQENGRNTVSALNQMRAKIEQLKAVSFDTLPSSGGDFVLAGINGKMRVEGHSSCIYPSGATAANCRLYNIRVVAGWVQRGSRIIGEGVLSSGTFSFSDVNGNGRIDSPVVLETALARRS